MKEADKKQSKSDKEFNLLLPFEEKSDNKEERILFRSRNDYLFAGVLGGLAHYWNVDSKLARFLFLLSIPLSGAITLIIYLILMKAIPLEPE
ncbi:MAG: PspC domain-containing protein [Asgard group archaeon]|nr:PspC domain-containing protein [Asgard group archaeon]